MLELTPDSLTLKRKKDGNGVGLPAFRGYLATKVLKFRKEA